MRLQTLKKTSVRVQSATVLVILGLLMLGGCTGDSFVPPPSPELEALRAERPAESKTLSVELILTAKPTPTSELWADAARFEAGLSKTMLQVRRPGPDAPPAAQATLIREAVERGVSAILVDPVDAPEVTEALNAAAARGTVVVLLDRQVPDRDPSKPMARVSFGPIDEPARQLVAALAEDIKTKGLTADGHVLIALSHDADRHYREAAERLVVALKAAHFSEARIVPLEGDLAEGIKTLVDQTLADPKVTGLLGVELSGFDSTANAHNDLLEQAKRRVSVGACLAMERTIVGSIHRYTVGVVDFKQKEFSRKALGLALRLARGEPGPTVLEVPVEFKPSEPRAEPVKPAPSAPPATRPT